MTRASSVTAVAFRPAAEGLSKTAVRHQAPAVSLPLSLTEHLEQGAKTRHIK